MKLTQKDKEYLEFIRLRNNLEHFTGLIIDSLNRKPAKIRKPLDPLENFYLITLTRRHK